MTPSQKRHDTHEWEDVSVIFNNESSSLQRRTLIIIINEDESSY